MTDDQQNLKAEYGRLLKVRSALQQAVNTATAGWDGKGEKPASLAEAEAKRDELDIELAKLADKAKFQTG